MNNRCWLNCHQALLLALTGLFAMVTSAATVRAARLFPASSPQSNTGKQAALQSTTETKIAFVAFPGGNAEIYIINADGSPSLNVTNNPAADFSPSWSPDMSKLAFESNRDGNYQIYVMNANGTAVQRLTYNLGADTDPAWSPDGRRIAFVRSGDIWLMNADGTGQIQVTHEPTTDGDPSWSPNGIKIAFTATRDGNSEIYVMNADGTSQQNLTNNPAQDYSPEWSPDGTRIAFVSERDGNREIYSMRPDGTQQTNLTQHPLGEQWPTWSPDSTKIAFTSFRTWPSPLMVMNADGTNQIQLTTPSSNNYEPAWSPWLPRLSLPFPHDVGDTGIKIINSFFDHEYPLYPSEPASVSGSIMRYTGKKLRGTRWKCVPGESCYSGHDGYDFGLDEGTAVWAAHDGYAQGSQLFCSSGSSLINVVTVTQGRYQTAYLHLQDDAYWQDIRNNPRNVHTSDRIGTVGRSGSPVCTTGHHLHFGVKYDVNNDGNFKAVDPYGWQPAQFGQPDPWPTYPGGAPSEWLWSFSPPDLGDSFPSSATMLASGNASVNIPPGAVTQQALLALTVVPEPGSNPATGSLHMHNNSLASTSETLAVGDTYQLSGIYSDGSPLTTFTSPVTTTITYTNSNLIYINTDTLGLYQWDTTSLVWMPLASAQNTYTQQVSATINSPSFISLRGQPLSPAPTLLSAFPSSLLNTSENTMVVTGTNFISPPSLFLGIVALNTIYVSPSRLTATIPPSVAPGIYTLTLRNPDAQIATLPNDIEVLQPTYLPVIQK